MRSIGLRYIFLLLCIFTGRAIKAQSEIGSFILSGKENANKLAEAYLEPLGKSMSLSLGSGWFIGSTKLDAGHFEISLVGTATFGNLQDQTFDVRTIGLSSEVKVYNDSEPLAPTALSHEDMGSHLEVSAINPHTGEPIFLTDFHTPEGLNLPFVPLGMPQLRLGLIKDTELLIRFLPKISMNIEGKNHHVHAWGIGIKHHIDQWISYLQQHKLSLILGVTYSRQKAQAGLSRTAAYRWQGGKVTQLTEEQKDLSRYDHQSVRIENQVMVFNVLLSKSFQRLTLKGGGNFLLSKIFIDTPGIYPQRDIRATEQEPYYEYFFNDISYPIHTEFPYHPVLLVLGADYQYKAFNIGASGNLGSYKAISLALGLVF